MILPTKHLPVDRSLIVIGAEIVELLDEPKSVSRLWLDFQQSHEQHHARLSFDWFTLAVAMLFTIEGVELKGNRLRKREMTL
jgi:hypothetical protein